jgi:hypothetical protein
VLDKGHAALSSVRGAKLLDGITRGLGARALERQHAAPLHLHLGNLNRVRVRVRVRNRIGARRSEGLGQEQGWA